MFWPKNIQMSYTIFTVKFTSAFLNQPSNNLKALDGRFLKVQSNKTTSFRIKDVVLEVQKNTCENTILLQR